MEAYRVGFRRLWDAMVAEACDHARLDDPAVRVLTEKVFAAQDIYTDAMAIGYREEQTRRLRSDESRRSELIDALLHGRVFDRSSVWEAADYLRLPATGPFVAVAAEVPTIGKEALPGIESKLRGIDVYSAWHVLPDLHAGIVHIKTDKKHDDVVALLSRMTRTRIGVSARFDDLRDTAKALHYARLMLSARPDPDEPVLVFDGSILATAAVSAPEVMVSLAAPVIDCFAELPDNERASLFHTFKVWLDVDGSLRTAGERLFCHPNTVRYRLHRIEQRTGRSLSRPRDIAELCLAFEVQRRLM
jgi:sugar diacid utilization regulator